MKKKTHIVIIDNIVEYISRKTLVTQNPNEIDFQRFVFFDHPPKPACNLLYVSLD